MSRYFWITSLSFGILFPSSEYEQRPLGDVSFSKSLRCAKTLTKNNSYPPMSNNIESHLIENRVFKPAKAFSKTAQISSLAEYQELYRKSIKNPEKFWAQQAVELLLWQKKWKKVLDWKEPFAKWFVGGKLNVSENCLDRHLNGVTRNKAALIWEGEPGDKVTL